MSTSKRDLFVVVADLDAFNVIKTLLLKRQQALGVRLNLSEDDLLRYSGRDPGCLKDAAAILRPKQMTHRHAMVIFDRHGSGRDSSPAIEIARGVENELRKSGWDTSDAAAVVMDPELEAWVWSQSPHVADLLGWGEERAQLRPYLEGRGLWPAGTEKPIDPKQAMESATREKRKPLVSPVFSELAERVSITGCLDRSFLKFQKTLRRWFPA